MTESTKSESAASATTSEPRDADAASSGTTADTGDAGATSSADAAQDAGASRMFGGLGPREAAQKRWREKRERERDEDQAQAASARSEVVLVRVTVETGKVIDRLAQDAKGGNTQAARELREWLARVEQETDVSVSALDRATRHRMKARLLAELREGAEPDPSPQRPSAPEPSSTAHRAVDDGAAGQTEAEAHPADAGTPVNAEA